MYVRLNLSVALLGTSTETRLQVRGKKNLVIEKALTGPIGVFVKFSTLQEYGVDRVFLLENGNVDSSQRNVVFLARGENAIHTQAIAGMCVLKFVRRSLGVYSRISLQLVRGILK